MKLPKIRIPSLVLIEIADKIITIIGIGCIFAGFYQIYPPAAWIVIGIILAWPGMPRKAVK